MSAENAPSQRGDCQLVNRHPDIGSQRSGSITSWSLPNRMGRPDPLHPHRPSDHGLHCLSHHRRAPSSPPMSWSPPLIPISCTFRRSAFRGCAERHSRAEAADLCLSVVHGSVTDVAAGSDMRAYVLVVLPAQPRPPPSGTQTVRGSLRITRPGGSICRTGDTERAAGRSSRDGEGRAG
jgi:hypothetical protein